MTHFNNVLYNFLGGRSEYKLQKVNLRMYDTSVCTAAFARDRTLPEGIVEEGQICAGDTTGQRDTCQVSFILKYFGL